MSPESGERGCRRNTQETSQTWSWAQQAAPEVLEDQGEPEQEAGPERTVKFKGPEAREKKPHARNWKKKSKKFRVAEAWSLSERVKNK